MTDPPLIAEEKGDEDQASPNSRCATRTARFTAIAKAQAGAARAAAEAAAGQLVPSVMSSRSTVVVTLEHLRVKLHRKINAQATVVIKRYEERSNRCWRDLETAHLNACRATVCVRSVDLLPVNEKLVECTASISKAVEDKDCQLLAQANPILSRVLERERRFRSIFVMAMTAELAREDVDAISSCDRLRILQNVPWAKRNVKLVSKALRHEMKRYLPEYRARYSRCERRLERYEWINADMVRSRAQRLGCVYVKPS